MGKILNEIKGFGSLFYFQIIATSLSVFPLHISGFTFAIPRSLNATLDFEFRINLSLQIAIISVFSIFLATYLPKFFISARALIIAATIHIKYQKRKYKRARPIYFKQVNLDKFNLVDEISRPIEYSKHDARLANFIKARVKKITLLDHYESFKFIITSILSFLILSLLYVGPLRALVASALFLAFLIIVVTYDDYGDAFFFRSEGFVVDKSARDDIAVGFNFGRLPALLGVIAVFSFALGYMRADYMMRSPIYAVTCCESKEFVNLVASTSGGFLFFKSSTGEFFYTPSPTVYDVVP